MYLDDINCIGSEDVLVNCSRRLFGDISTNCKTHLEDASVLCTTGKTLINQQHIILHACFVHSVLRKYI